MSTRIPRALFRGANMARQQSQETHEQWFTRAVAAVWDELPEHYQQTEEEAKAPFPIVRRRARQPGTELLQYPLRLPVDTAAALADRVAEVRAPSMADFISVVLARRLAQLGIDVADHS